MFVGDEDYYGEVLKHKQGMYSEINNDMEKLPSTGY